jgi:hypothetical protein
MCHVYLIFTSAFLQFFDGFTMMSTGRRKAADVFRKATNVSQENCFLSSTLSPLSAISFSHPEVNRFFIVSSILSLSFTEQPDEAGVFIEAGVGGGGGEGAQTSVAGAGTGDRVRGGSETLRRFIVAVDSRAGSRFGLDPSTGISAGASFGKVFSMCSFGVAAGVSTGVFRGFSVCCVNNFTSDAASGTGLPGGVKDGDGSSGSSAGAGVGKGDSSARGLFDGGSKAIGAIGNDNGRG